jgi:pimeloyl-ACP methyl ester carboxylesterase
MQAFVRVLESAPLLPTTFVRIMGDFFARGRDQAADYSSVPLLVLYADDDRVTPWKQHGAIATQAVPHATIRRIDGGSHFLHLQKPHETADSIVAFLERRT